MSEYVHKVNYYETDKMGITHHSNYIRFMEEARLHFLEAVGYPLWRLEAEGVTSPVVSLDCQYKHPTTYGDELSIQVTVEAYTGVKLVLSYVMHNTATGKLVATAKSSHCFIDEKGCPIAVRKRFQGFDLVLHKEAAHEP